MGSSDFRTHEKKKIKKSILEKKAQNQTGSGAWQLPQVEIIKKGFDKTLVGNIFERILPALGLTPSNYQDLFIGSVFIIPFFAIILN